MKSQDRRSFLKNASVLGAAGLASPWALNLAAMGSASAQTSGLTDYKALVCLFLAGGNDAHNTLLNTAKMGWHNYRSARDTGYDQGGDYYAPSRPLVEGETSISLDVTEVLPITHKNANDLNDATDPTFGCKFGLHPQLKRTRDMYAAGKAAIVANVGPLIQPITRDSYYGENFVPKEPVPRSLFSHNDQASTWQSFAPEGAVGGWGGRMMDSLMSNNHNATFSSIGINGGSVWLAGNQVMPYKVGASGVRQMAGPGSTFGSKAVYDAVREIAAAVPYRQDTLGTLGKDYAKTVARALSVEQALMAALQPSDKAPWGTLGTLPSNDPLLQYINPNTGKSAVNPLAVELQMVARMIDARKNTGIGVKRQVFMVTTGPYDTHSNQPAQHADLLAQLDHAIGYFYDVLSKMDGDISSQVTSFTASDFGRALLSNGDGTDHGWGGHHFVYGGSVKGGDVYGRFAALPTINRDTGFAYSEDFLDNGVLIPELSVDQYAYTLGEWMGVHASDLTGVGGTSGITPNIGNFSQPNLGFMKKT